MGEGGRPLVRPWLWVVLGVAVMGLVGLGAYSLVSSTRERIAHAQSQQREVGVAREERQHVVLRVAPGPLPRALPLTGNDGVDADGYPRRYVDRVGLRSLLAFHKFAELTNYFEQFQAAFEADPRKEYWPIDAGEAFESAEPEIVADLDAWVAATPQSFAPYLARGTHYVAAMWARRGEDYASKTAAEDLGAMRDAGHKATADLDRALELRPRLVAAMRDELRVGMVTSDLERLSAMRERATKACPDCLQIRASYLRSLTPRWGGSYEAMRAFVAESPPRLNPRFRALAGYEDLDRAELATIARKYPEALAAIDRATNLGDCWEYPAERGQILRALERYDEAAASLDRAAAQRPMEASIVGARAIVQYGRKEYLMAGRDLLMTLRIDPTDSDATTNLPYVLRGIVYQTHRLDLAGKHEDALEAGELGLEIGPTDRDVNGIYARTVLGDATTPDRIAVIQAHVAESPGDFRAVQQLDYALSKQGGQPFEHIAQMWTAYLALRPDDGRAYIERAGTYHHLGRSADATADAQRACQLGINEGCERAAQ